MTSVLISAGSPEQSASRRGAVGPVGLCSAFCLALGQAPGLSPLVDPPIHLPSSQAEIEGLSEARVYC